jgi:hypothetical protein
VRTTDCRSALEAGAEQGQRPLLRRDGGLGGELPGPLGEGGLVDAALLLAARLVEVLGRQRLARARRPPRAERRQRSVDLVVQPGQRAPLEAAVEGRPRKHARLLGDAPGQRVGQAVLGLEVPHRREARVD